MSAEIRRGTHRFAEREQGRLSRHSFSFGDSYDAQNLRFGPMLCHDDHLLGLGKGFESHQHRDLLIVSYVVNGVLAHTGPGGDVEVGAGTIAVLRTGDGVEHREVAAAQQTRFVQAWLVDDAAAEPSYELHGGDELDLPGARLEILRLGGGETAALPAAPLLHVYVARGALLRSSLAEPLQEGDAFRFTDEPSHPVTAGVPTELMVWSFS